MPALFRHLIKSQEKMRRIIIEFLLILIISLFLSLIYNAVSPSGIRILPKKAEKKAEITGGGVIVRSEVARVVRQPHISNKGDKRHT